MVPLSLGAQLTSPQRAHPLHQAHQPPSSLWGPILQPVQNRSSEELGEACLPGTQSQVSSATLLPAVKGLAEQLSPLEEEGFAAKESLRAPLGQQQRHWKNTTWNNCPQHAEENGAQEKNSTFYPRATSGTDSRKAASFL